MLCIIVLQGSVGENFITSVLTTIPDDMVLDSVEMSIAEMCQTRDATSGGFEELETAEEEERCGKISAGLGKHWNDLSPEEHEERCVKISAGLEKLWNDLSPEEREEQCGKISSTFYDKN